MALNGFIKTTQKTPENELKLARDRMDEFKEKEAHDEKKKGAKR